MRRILIIIVTLVLTFLSAVIAAFAETASSPFVSYIAQFFALTLPSAGIAIIIIRKMEDKMTNGDWLTLCLCELFASLAIASAALAEDLTFLSIGSVVLAAIWLVATIYRWFVSIKK